jgi:hypothetical protein
MNITIVVLKVARRLKACGVDEAFKVLNATKLTTHKEGIRRWLGQGLINGPTLSSGNGNFR